MTLQLGEQIRGLVGDDVPPVDSVVVPQGWTAFRARRLTGMPTRPGGKEQKNAPLSPFVSTGLGVVGPGVVPRHCKINDLNCQTALTAAMGAKGIFLHCQTPHGRLGLRELRQSCSEETLLERG